jgi:hypothetical protein
MTKRKSWESVFRQSRGNRIKVKRLIGLYDVLTYVGLVWAMHSVESPWLRGLAAGVGVALVSPLPQVVLACWWEPKPEERHIKGNRPRDHFKRIFNPKTQSWAFLTDPVGLGPMMVVAAVNLPLLPHNTLFNGELWWLWAIISFAVGVGLSWTFRKGEGDAYDPLRYNSYSKWWHNGAAFTVLSAWLVYTLIQMMTGWGVVFAACVLYLMFFAIWALGAGGDGWRAGLMDQPNHRFYWLRLDPRNLHPQADAHGRRILVEYVDIPTWNEFVRGHADEAIGWSDVLQTRKLMPLMQRTLSPLSWRRRSRREQSEIETPTPNNGAESDQPLRDQRRAKDEPRRPG